MNSVNPVSLCPQCQHKLFSYYFSLLVYSERLKSLWLLNGIPVANLNLGVFFNLRNGRLRAATLQKSCSMPLESCKYGVASFSAWLENDSPGLGRRTTYYLIVYVYYTWTRSHEAAPAVAKSLTFMKFWFIALYFIVCTYITHGIYIRNSYYWKLLKIVE